MATQTAGRLISRRVESSNLVVGTDGIDVCGNISVAGNVITPNIIGNNSQSIKFVDNIVVKGNISMDSSASISSNVIVNGLILSDNENLSISFVASSTNFGGTRTVPSFYRSGFAPCAMLPYEMKIYGIQLTAGAESQTYTGNIDVELYSSESTTPFFQESIQNTDSRWIVQTTFLDGSMTSSYGRAMNILFDNPVVLPQFAVIQVIYDSSNSFTGTGIELSTRILARTCF